MKNQAKYNYEENSIYGKRLVGKIHLKKDSYSLKKYKSLITFWGCIGYLGWEIMVKNNDKIFANFSRIKLEKDLIKLGDFYTNNKPLAEFNSKDYENFNGKKKICNSILNNLSEENFTETLNHFLCDNKTDRMVALKFLTPRFESIKGLNSLKKLSSNRWMSFTLIPKIDFESVVKDPMFYLPITSVGGTFIFEFMILEIPLCLKYIKTHNLCDPNEILIHSSELFNKEKELRIEFLSI